MRIFCRYKYLGKLVLISMVSILVAGLCGCSTVPATADFSEITSFSESEAVSLWVVTEETMADGMNQQVKYLSEQFHTQYPNVSFRLDILPSEETERQNYLESLRDEMANGGGPDVFLMPTNPVLVLDNPRMYTYLRVAPLFEDVDQAMRSGTFMDVSSFYDADVELGKEHLAMAVMNAGVVKDARYVLPLRYTMPVMYVFPEEAKARGVDENMLSQNIDDWMAFTLELGDPLIACGAEYNSFNVFSDFLDYDAKKVVLEKDVLASYLEAYQKLEELIGTEAGHRNNAWLDSYLQGRWEPFPVQIASVSNAMTYAAVSKMEGKQLEMYPVKTIDGDVVATVSYYGAIGRNCKNPEAAYLFLRMFLQEDAQWEMKRAENCESQYPGLMEQSWPVRNVGAVTSLWNNQKHSALSSDSNKIAAKTAALEQVNLVQQDIPILQTQIQIARFPLTGTGTLGYYTRQLNDYEQSNQAAKVDMDQIAEEILDALNAKVQ